MTLGQKRRRIEPKRDKTFARNRCRTPFAGASATLYETPVIRESSPMRHVLRSKIHNAYVTEANLAYIGSITIDEALMEAVGL